MSSTKRLTKSRTDKVVDGVCAGLGEYLDLDPVLIRFVFAALLIMHPVTGILAYIILTVIMPEDTRPAVTTNRMNTTSSMSPSSPMSSSSPMSTATPTSATSPTSPTGPTVPMTPESLLSPMSPIATMNAADFANAEPIGAPPGEPAATAGAAFGERASATGDDLGERMKEAGVRLESELRSAAHTLQQPGAGGSIEHRRTNWGAVILIGLGLMFLLQNFDMIPNFDIGNFWPLLLIVIGIAMLRKRQGSVL